MSDYYKKYLKYKEKYLTLQRQQMGGLLTSTSALMIVDPQNDFCPGGSLAVTDGNDIFPHINRLVQLFSNKTIFISQDWHPKNHMSFASNQSTPVGPFTAVERVAIDAKTGETVKFTQVVWPDHCVQGSMGAEISPLLKRTGNEIIIKKGKDTGNQVDSYSAFGDAFGGKFERTELRNMVSDMRLKLFVVVGLATDYCVGSTAIDAKKFFPGMTVIVIQECMKGVCMPTLNGSDTCKDKIQLMKDKGIIVLDTVREFVEKYVVEKTVY